MSERKYPAIDIIAIYRRGSTEAWNHMLETMFDRQDVEGLKKVLYGIQAGMADAAKAKLVTDEIADWFIRAQRSLEITAKRIFRAKYPNPLDDPRNAQDPEALKHLDAKRKRDNEFEQFLLAARF